MALKVPISLPTGVTADYFKIKSVTIDFENGNMSCNVKLFKDKDARDTGKFALLDPVFFGLQTMVDVRADLYTELKKNTFTKGAMAASLDVDFTKAEDC